MDIDAHEVNALKGMHNILSSRLLRAIIIEVRESTLKDVERIVSSYGFICKEKNIEGVGNIVFTK